MANQFTERQMLDLLHQRYSQTNPGNGPRYACAEHVKNEAGFFHQRTADFIAMDLWPSKGLELHGHEVKCSRADWLTELKDPSKAEAFKRYMDRWWLVVSDPKIVYPEELPEGWGLIVATKYKISATEWRPASEGHRLRVKAPAPKLTPEPLPRSMLACLMRSTAKTSKRRSHQLFCKEPCGHQRWMLA